ncbi:hypothetical protein IPH25_01770 [bacterium]|nr:MAG: hypothetical protein IPG37_03900 [bacterium]QQR62153.1 MAG: hypothetical protein IPH25_01770 [bacterium]QQR63290.1 MAG: hypothetical protein IPH67_02340 [bacterium]
MKKIVIKIAILGSLLQTSFAYGWATPEGNVGNTTVPKINFYGSISTHQGNRWQQAENITIDGRYKQIQMYFKPELLPEKVLNTQTNKESITLKDDPNQYAQTKIDLEEVESIEAVPNLIYLYSGSQTNKNYPTQYTELIVTMKDKNLKQYHCLLTESTKLMWDEKSSSGLVNSNIQIGSIKKLTIAGSKTQEIVEKK